MTAPVWLLGTPLIIYIWAPVKILYMWVVATLMAIVFLGRAYHFPGFCGNQHIRDSTWSQNPFLNRLGNGLRSCFVGFRCFGNTSCSFHFAFICMHLPSFSFHLHASSFHFAFISFHVPFMLLSCSFHLYLLISLHFPFIFLSCSFQCAFMSFHLPFICMHFPFILHSCPFISFPKLWKLWLYGLAGGPSATNAYRQVIAKVIAK